MLKHNTKPYHVEETFAPPQGAAASGLNVDRLVAMGRRQWWVIALVACIVILGASAYLMAASPIYQAKAQVLLDTRKLQLFQTQAVVSDASLEASAVESQLELMRSESVASSVINDFDLANDPEFNGEETSRLQRTVNRVLRLVGRVVPALDPGPASVSAEERTRAALRAFRANLQIQRVRTTFVVEVGFTSLDAVKAGKIANAVADAYILDATQSKQYTTRRAMNWLQERIGELREQALTADRAVEAFKNTNNLARVGNVNLTEQQFEEVNRQLTQARAVQTDAKLRLERLRGIISSKIPDAVMAAWLQNDIVNRLRQSYVEVSRREAEFSVRLGPDHQATVSARKEMRQIEQSAGLELNRLAMSWQDDVTAADARVANLEQQLTQETQQNSTAREQQGALVLLQTTAKNYHALFDLFSQRYMEAAQQQDFSTSEARTITSADSGLRIAPNPRQVLPMGVIFGLLLGCGAAYLREARADVLRTCADFEDRLGIDCLGILPLIPDRVRTDGPNTGGDLGARHIAQKSNVTREVLLEPFSRFAETIRNVKIAIDTNAVEVKTIGIVSAIPGEGKSTVSVNVAQLAASVGRRTLLIDVDFRDPSLTRSLAPSAEAGLIEVLSGQKSLAEVVWTDDNTDLEFLPAHMTRRMANTSELLKSQAMDLFLSRAREVYDYVILDFPPMALVVDAKAMSHIVDGFLVVAEWGGTGTRVISETLAAADIVRRRVIGGVLNRANPQALEQMEAYKGLKMHNYYHA